MERIKREASQGAQRELAARARELKPQTPFPMMTSPPYREKEHELLKTSLIQQKRQGNKKKYIVNTSLYKETAFHRVFGKKRKARSGQERPQILLFNYTIE